MPTVMLERQDDIAIVWIDNPPVNALSQAVRAGIIDNLNEALAEKAQKALAAEGYGNVHVIVGDGSLGLATEAPFDAILVTAGGPEIPESLKQQLKIGGRLVIPVGGTRTFQDLLKITRTGEKDFTEENLGGVRFVPLVGEEGWTDTGIF